MYILSLWMERETVCTEEVAIGRIREANRGLIITQNKKTGKNRGPCETFRALETSYL